MPNSVSTACSLGLTGLLACQLLFAGLPEASALAGPEGQAGCFYLYDAQANEGACIGPQSQDLCSTTEVEAVFGGWLADYCRRRDGVKTSIDAKKAELKTCTDSAAAHNNRQAAQESSSSQCRAKQDDVRARTASLSSEAAAVQAKGRALKRVAAKVCKQRKMKCKLPAI